MKPIVQEPRGSGGRGLHSLPAHAKTNTVLASPTTVVAAFGVILDDDYRCFCFCFCTTGKRAGTATGTAGGPAEVYEDELVGT